jgi:hypothetical protein
LGWQIQHTDQGDIISHGGSYNGFHSIAAASVARKSGYVVMTNGDNGTTVLMKLVLGDVLPQVLAP